MRGGRRVAGELDRDQLALYDLIWKRSVASLMAPAVYDQVSADVVATPVNGAEPHLFRATGSTTVSYTHLTLPTTERV